MANETKQANKALSTSKFFGTPEFGKLPNGPARFDGTGRNPRATVSAFTVRVPIQGTSLALLTTCYGQKQGDGDVEFTIRMPGLGSAGRSAILAASDEVRSHFQAFVQEHAEAWPGYDAATDAAIGVLYGVKTAASAPRLVKKAPIIAELATQVAAVVASTPAGQQARPAR